MTVQRLHHVAYRCTDARETVDFYELIEKDGLYYKRNSDVPFTGKIKDKKNIGLMLKYYKHIVP